VYFADESDVFSGKTKSEENSGYESDDSFQPPQPTAAPERRASRMSMFLQVCCILCLFFVGFFLLLVP
jgi:hypothetical protein